ncbi:spermidine/putrescine transport system substrate-binding protein [Bradyrhizobium sp. LA6.10]|uniref:ABC transporter substrate-binding protein n=1 Tax=Bradyrhizobium sp. LA6.10 TaxID=3156318 RepID=UPI003399F87C
MKHDLNFAKLTVAACLWSCAISGSVFAQQKELRIDRNPDRRAELFQNIVIKPWAEKNAVKIVQGTFNSDEQVLATARATPGALDLIYMGGTSVYRGIKLGLLEQIRLENVPNFTKYVNKKYQHQKVDTGPGTHHLADAPGVFLVVYAKEKFPTPPAESYAVLHDPQYKGKFAVRDYAIYEFLMNAAYLGYNIEELTSLTKEQEAKLFETVGQQRKLVKTYWKSGAENRTLLANREIWISDYWISPTLDQKKELNLGWFMAKEGSPMWMQGWAIGKGAKNRDLAESLLNYYYDPKVFMEYKRALGSDIVILNDDAYDRAGFEKDYPDLAKMGQAVSERGKDINPEFIEKIEAKWIERFEEIKLDAN